MRTISARPQRIVEEHGLFALRHLYRLLLVVAAAHGRRLGIAVHEHVLLEIRDELVCDREQDPRALRLRPVLLKLRVALRQLRRQRVALALRLGGGADRLQAHDGR